MRVTNRLLQQRAVADLQSTMAALDRARTEAATGRRIAVPSDDPVGAATVLRIEQGLRNLDHYRRATSGVRARLDAEEAVLDQVGELLGRARELATQQGTATATPVTRAAAAAEVTRILEQVVALGNTTVEGDYLFGGTRTDAPPFQPDGTYVGDTTQARAEIGAGMLVPVADHGDRLLVSSDVLAGLGALRDALQADDAVAVRASGARLVDAFDRVQITLADAGGRQRQLDVALANFDALEGSLELRRSLADEVPLEEAATRFATLQTALESALATTSRLLNTSLVEYLR
jgi:flagellar hook-associated protein 3 FlgL